MLKSTIFFIFIFSACLTLAKQNDDYYNYECWLHGDGTDELQIESKGKGKVLIQIFAHSDTDNQHRTGKITLSIDAYKQKDVFGIIEYASAFNEVRFMLDSQILYISKKYLKSHPKTDRRGYKEGVHYVDRIYTKNYVGQDFGNHCDN